MNQLKIILTEKDIKRFWKYVDKKSDDECWEWLACKKTRGYGQIKISGKMYLAHRISWFLHNGEIPVHNSYNGMCVLHICDNTGCVNPSHLLLGTHSDNMRDMKNKERGVIGEKNGNHKLTEKEVIEIREKYIPYKYSTRKLAKEYGVGATVVHYIVKRRRWKYMKEMSE